MINGKGDLNSIFPSFGESMILSQKIKNQVGGVP
jgi:hypothetical protein